jgi:hypothetical protein
LIDTISKTINKNNPKMSVTITLSPNENLETIKSFLAANLFDFLGSVIKQHDHPKSLKHNTKKLYGMSQIA